MTRAAILDAAWEVARADGIAGLTLRAVADRVGMRAPSLYSHFASKLDIYDAMFGQAWQAYDEELAALELPDEPREVLRALARTFVDFALADLPRYQLMDQRVIADFTPSPENYAPAVRVLERFRSAYARIVGEVRDDDVDLFIVMLSGLIGTQWSNDPGGTRYVRQVDRLVDMLADEFGLPVPARLSQGERS
ncbi:TetR/AcrR family transcriptional regulator [Pseudonocardia endophytica]|uniref:TetR/AcrR family transcriptional regulator n=1 Tax=Pseudonocardia endophytica TaxID=401976 RepID=UPI0014049C83|nr:TetR/AcrR family transcriptional regulator [Pseudonocardia endophytica]